MFVVISSPSEAADSSLLFIAIAIYKPEDVRPILAAYHGKDIPLEYGKKEAEIKAQFVEEWKKSGKEKSGGGLTLSGLFLGSKQVSVRSLMSSIA